MPECQNWCTTDVFDPEMLIVVMSQHRFSGYQQEQYNRRELGTKPSRATYSDSDLSNDSVRCGIEDFENNSAPETIKISATLIHYLSNKNMSSKDCSMQKFNLTGLVKCMLCVNRHKNRYGQPFRCTRV